MYTTLFDRFCVFTILCSVTLASSQNISKPSLSPGTADFALIGCYSELNANYAVRALGLNGEYITTLVNSPNYLTVPLCLDSCRDGRLDLITYWIFAAVENERECFCGLTVHEDSRPVDPRLCSSPCAGNEQQSCGGYGFLTLYGRIFGPNSTARPTQTSIITQTSRLVGFPTATPSTSRSFPSATPSDAVHTPSTVRNESSKLSTSNKAGIITACVSSTLIVLAIAIYLYIRRRRKARLKEQNNIQRPLSHPLQSHPVNPILSNSGVKELPGSRNKVEMAVNMTGVKSELPAIHSRSNSLSWNKEHSIFLEKKAISPERNRGECDDQRHDQQRSPVELDSSPLTSHPVSTSFTTPCRSKDEEKNFDVGKELPRLPGDGRSDGIVMGDEESPVAGECGYLRLSIGGSADVTKRFGVAEFDEVGVRECLDGVRDGAVSRLGSRKWERRVVGGDESDEEALGEEERGKLNIENVKSTL